MRAGKAVLACLTFGAGGLWARSAGATVALPTQRSAGAMVAQAGAGGGAGTDDASITRRVEDKLADAAPTAEHVTVQTHNRIVTLSGRVDSDGMRERVGALATATRGVAAVNNQVVVVPRYPPAQAR
jgi:osmotically-inducible protein OsmY